MCAEIPVRYRLHYEYLMRLIFASFVMMCLLSVCGFIACRTIYVLLPSPNDVNVKVEHECDTYPVSSLQNIVNTQHSFVYLFITFDFLLPIDFDCHTPFIRISIQLMRKQTYFGRWWPMLVFRRFLSDSREAFSKLPNNYFLNAKDLPM